MTWSASLNEASGVRQRRGADLNQKHYQKNRCVDKKSSLILSKHHQKLKCARLMQVRLPIDSSGKSRESAWWLTRGPGVSPESQTKDPRSLLRSLDGGGGRRPAPPSGGAFSSRARPASSRDPFSSTAPPSLITTSTSSTVSSLGECFSILTRGEGTKTPPPRPRALVTLIGHAAPILTGTTQLPNERAWGVRSRGSL